MRYMLILLLFLTACSTVSETTVRNDLQSAFTEQGIANGTFVLLDVQSGALTSVNAARANTRYAPASTFKIANSLIALQTGAVRDTQQIIPYGGKPQPFAQWEHDMTLPQAIKVSNVPVYQEVARRIGRDRMAKWVNKLDYGNRYIGEIVDRFWLDGPLEISATEQATFLQRLLKNELPIDSAIQNTVREMVFLEAYDGMRLYGKTGWLMSHQPNIGWLAGWAEKDAKTHSFALNIDIHNKDDTAKRMVLVKGFLEELLG